MDKKTGFTLIFTAAFLTAVPLIAADSAAAELGSNDALLPELAHSALVSGSTVPPNGDVNPYGVAFVPHGFPPGGPLTSGDVLVSNFNNSGNLQGTGVTIVSIDPAGHQSLFFNGKSGLGLTTALGVTRNGLVLVGNVPTIDGTCSTIQPGSLLVLDRSGRMLANLTGPLLNGPWDLTIVEGDDRRAQAFVSNVLSGAVTRLELGLDAAGKLSTGAVQIASGYAHRCDPAALVVGPTGLAFDRERHVLYVASTADNAIYAVADADERNADSGKGALVYADAAHLRGPLGLVLAPNRHLITSNGDAVNGDPNHPSELVEFTVSGQFVAEVPVDAGGQGGAFGIAVRGSNELLRLAAVDDLNNTVKIWTVH